MSRACHAIRPSMSTSRKSAWRGHACCSYQRRVAVSCIVRRRVDRLSRAVCRPVVRLRCGRPCGLRIGCLLVVRKRTPERGATQPHSEHDKNQQRQPQPPISSQHDFESKEIISKASAPIIVYSGDRRHRMNPMVKSPSAGGHRNRHRQLRSDGGRPIRCEDR